MDKYWNILKRCICKDNRSRIDSKVLWLVEDIVLINIASDKCCRSYKVAMIWSKGLKGVGAREEEGLEEMEKIDRKGKRWSEKAWNERMKQSKGGKKKRRGGRKVRRADEVNVQNENKTEYFEY